MNLVVHQSNYIPWPGYFQLILNADLVCFYDDVQYTKNDWRNRNLIMGVNGPKWLTIPVHGSTSQTIDSVQIDATKNWQKKHLNSLLHCYSNYPNFILLRDFLDEFYSENKWTLLSDLNIKIIKNLVNKLSTKEIEFTDSKLIASKLKKQERLFEIIHHFNADTYLSGPGIFNYCRGEEFEKQGIELRIAKYQNDDFQRSFGGQNYNMSILDFISRFGYSSNMDFIGEDKFVNWKNLE